MWGVPAIAVILALIVLSTGANQSLFLSINRLSQFTGDALWANLTILGDGLVVFVLVLLFTGRRPAMVWALILTGALASVAAPVLKALIGGGRPAAVLPLESFYIIGPVLQSGSFPSGHTMAVFAFAGAVSLMMNRVWLTALLVLVAVATGLSRIVVGAHWPLDVLGGAAIGWLCAVGGIALARRWEWGLRVGAQRVFAVVLVLAALVLLGGYDSRYEQAVWFQRIIAVMCLLVAVPDLVWLFRRKR
ncbi:MAG: phosphatase PAP2 family protein [Rubrivivax sp.]|jgi:membrane-associated phospholipid phosphatase